MSTANKNESLKLDEALVKIHELICVLTAALGYAVNSNVVTKNIDDEDDLGVTLAGCEEIAGQIKRIAARAWENI